MRQDTARLQSSFADSRRARSELYDPDPASYPVTQAFARWVRSGPNAGIAYDSAGSAGGKNWVCYRPCTARDLLKGPPLAAHGSGCICHGCRISSRRFRPANPVM